MRMPFGKYADRWVRDVDSGYLRWVLNKVERLDHRLRSEIEFELRRRSPDSGEARREDAPPPRRDRGEEALAAINRWAAGLARRYHPDRGGSDLEMRVVNEARATLLETLRGEGLIG